jgi:hypothetical protein
VTETLLDRSEKALQPCASSLLFFLFLSLIPAPVLGLLLATSLGDVAFDDGKAGLLRSSAAAAIDSRSAGILPFSCELSLAVFSDDDDDEPGPAAAPGRLISSNSDLASVYSPSNKTTCCSSEIAILRSPASLRIKDMTRKPISS